MHDTAINYVIRYVLMISHLIAGGTPCEHLLIFVLAKYIL